MQVILNLFNNTAATATTPEQKVIQWLDYVHKILSKFNAIELHQLSYIENRIKELNAPADHPLVKKVQEFRSRHPSLKPLNSAKPEIEQNLAASTQLMQIPRIRGKVLNVKCSLDATKSVISGKNKFTEINLYDVDDMVLGLIALCHPNLETLRINTAEHFAFNFTDEGLRSIAKLQKLRILEITTWGSEATKKGFEELLSTPALQNNLRELTLCHNWITDKALNEIAGFKSLESLEFETTAMTTQGLLTLFQSASLKTTLRKIKVVTDDDPSKVSFNDAMLNTLANYKALQVINIGSNWQITEPNLLQFLEAQKNVLCLYLRGLALSPAVAAKIGEMNAMKILRVTDCSKLSTAAIGALLHNKSNITHMSLNKVEDLAVDVLANLPKLNVLYLSGCGMWNDEFDKFCSAPEMKKHLKELYLTDFPIVAAASLGNIKNLGALTVLRVDGCRKFNDDALRAILESPLKNQLTTLQLKDVTITEKSNKYLNDAANLKKLLLANCYAFTEEGQAQFFDLTNLQKNLTVLVLDDFLFPDAMVKKLEAFTSLTRFCIWNNYLLTDAGAQELYNRQDNSGGRLDLVIGGGDDGSIYSLFDGVL